MDRNDRRTTYAAMTFVPEAVCDAMDIVVAAVAGRPVSRAQLHAATLVLRYAVDPIPTNEPAFSTDDLLTSLSNGAD